MLFQEGDNSNLRKNSNHKNLAIIASLNLRSLNPLLKRNSMSKMNLLTISQRRKILKLVEVLANQSNLQSPELKKVHLKFLKIPLNKLKIKNSKSQKYNLPALKLAQRKLLLIKTYT